MASEGIIKRRLKSLRQREDEKAERAKQRKERLQRQAEANGVTIDVQRAIDRTNDFASVCRPMPLSFYYGEGSTPERDAAFMRRRASFYSMCAKVFGWQGWDFEVYAKEIYLAEQVAGGRDGRGQRLAPIDQTQAVNLNVEAAPLEFLVAQKWLETDKDPDGAGAVRWATALRFRDEVAGSQSGGLKGQNIEGGSGGFGPRLVSDYALDCMVTVTKIREKMHPGLFRLLHMAVVDDIWVWEITKTRRRRTGAPVERTERQQRQHRQWQAARRRQLDARRDRIILKLHKAIDGAAVVFNFITEDEYRARWVKKTAATSR